MSNFKKKLSANRDFPNDDITKEDIPILIISFIVMGILATAIQVSINFIT